MLKSGLVGLLAVAIIATSCGGKAATCDELADQTIGLVQDLIDDVEADVGDMTIDEIVASEDDLPSLERFRDRSADVNARAAELGCTQTELREMVIARLGHLEATTPVGRLIIEGIRSGGL